MGPKGIYAVAHVTFLSTWRCILILLSSCVAALLLLAEAERWRMYCDEGLEGVKVKEEWAKWGFRNGGGGLGCLHTFWIDEWPHIPFLAALNSINRLASRHPTTARFSDLDWYFPGHRAMEENYLAIRAEASRLLHHQHELPSYQDVDARMKRVDPQDRWRVFIVKWYNDFITENSKLAPQTTEILRKLPQVKSAMFSILQPGQTIVPHSGPYCGSLRYHLGLIVPEGEVFISVDDVKYKWEEGKSLLFDDTFEHWIVNNSTERRVVLFVDVTRRPDEGMLGDLVWTLNELVSEWSYVREFFSAYNRKTEVQGAVCCGDHCDTNVTYCPDA